MTRRAAAGSAFCKACRTPWAGAAPATRQSACPGPGCRLRPPGGWRPRRHYRRHHRAPAGPPVPAAAVDHHPDDHLPVQLIVHMIAQTGERLPALRAAVPAAGKVPDHLDPGQMRVIPPSRPRPRTARPAALPAACPVLAPAPSTVLIRPCAPGRARSDDRPNTSRCSTASSAFTRSSSASRHASSIRSRVFSARSSAAVRSQRSFASSARARPPSATRQHPPPRPREPAQSQSTADTPASPKSRTRPGVSH